MKRKLGGFVAAGLVTLAACQAGPPPGEKDAMKEKQPVACTLAAMEPQERTAHLERLARLLDAATTVAEKAGSFDLRFPWSEALAGDLAAWTLGEARCCSFLRFQISLDPAEGSMGVEILGDEAAKEVLRPFLRARLK